MGDFERIYRSRAPPDTFIADAVELPVVGAAQRDRELVADLASHRARLGEP
jgi:hypothetical protein